MDWDAFEGIREFEGGKRGPNAAYCSSKLANVLFGIKLAEKLKVYKWIEINNDTTNCFEYILLGSRSSGIHCLSWMELY